jgi:cell wall assembly regulator SMI1
MMERSFEILAQWIEQQDPNRRRPLNEPASADEIAATERRLGLKLPAAVRNLYCLANGQPSDAVSLEGSFVLLSLDGIVEAAAFLNDEFPDGVNVHASDDASVDADPGIRASWWSRSWVPIMENGGGDYLFVDLDPAKAGNQGQIITYFHDEMFRSLVAPGLDAMLEDLAARLASGRCRIEDCMIEKD